MFSAPETSDADASFKGVLLETLTELQVHDGWTDVLTAGSFMQLHIRPPEV